MRYCGIDLAMVRGTSSSKWPSGCTTRTIRGHPGTDCPAATVDGHRVGLQSAAEFSKAGRGGSGTVPADRHSPFVVRQIAVQGSRWLII